MSLFVQRIARETTALAGSNPQYISTTKNPIVLPPVDAIVVGIMVPEDANQATSISTYTSAAGQSPHIIMTTHSWTEPLYYSSIGANIRAVPATMMVSWDPSTIALTDITSGSQDSALASRVSEAKSWPGTPFFIRFGHEMNLNTFSGTPAEFVAAWRYVVNYFRSHGVTNGSWIWSPNVWANGRFPFEAFYPGDDYVDWVGLDGYNYSTGGTHQDAWETLDQVFTPSYNLLKALTNRPMMFAETASTEAGAPNGTSKADWITTGFLTTVPTKFPLIKVVMWWEETNSPDGDLRVTTSTASQTAWQGVVANSLYQGSF